MTSAVLDPPVTSPDRTPKPLTEGKQGLGILIALWAFVVIPFLALVTAVPVAWGGFLTWTDVVIGLVFYVFAGRRHHGRFPPVPDPRLVQGEALAAGHFWRLPDPRPSQGSAHPVGRRSPPAPRLLRRRGRPALSVALTAPASGA